MTGYFGSYLLIKGFYIFFKVPTKTLNKNEGLRKRERESLKAVSYRYAIQKQPCGDVLRKKCSENMQPICKRTPMLKCDFNKVSKQLYWNLTSAWLFSCEFAAFFQNAFSWQHLSRTASAYWTAVLKNFAMETFLRKTSEHLVLEIYHRVPRETVATVLEIIFCP